MALYDPAALSALQERSVAVENLTGAVEARSGLLLAAGDRLLTLSRTAPGAIALPGVSREEEGLLPSTYPVRQPGPGTPGVAPGPPTRRSAAQRPRR